MQEQAGCVGVGLCVCVCVCVCVFYQSSTRQHSTNRPTRIQLRLLLNICLVIVNVIFSHAVERVRRLKEVFASDGCSVLVVTLYDTL